MKPLFCKQYLPLAIVLCIITSCKLTGNFAIVKRQHERGYYIETPSFVKNSDSRTTQAKKPSKQPETAKPVIDNDNENLIASVNAIPLVETAPQAKTIIQTKVNYAPQYTVNPIGRDTIKEKNSSDNTNETLNKASNNILKFDWISLTAFIICCVTFPLLIFYFSVRTAALVNLIGITMSFQLLGIILGFIGKHRIKKEHIYLKGKEFALAAIIMGFLFLYLLFVLFMILNAHPDFNFMI